MNDKIKVNGIFLFIFFVLMACNIIVDIYVPMLGQISSDLHSNMNLVQSTVSIEFIGYAVGSLFAGVFQNKYSLKHLMLFGSLIVVVASLLSSVALSIFPLFIGRVVQGVGCGVTFTMLGIIIARNYQGHALVKMYSLIGVIVAIMPLLSPIVGVFIAELISWRADFIFLAICFVLVAICILYFVKDRKDNFSNVIGFSQLIKNYIRPLKYMKFTLLSLMSGLALGGHIMLISLAPYYFEHMRNFTPTKISYILASNAVPLLVASVINFLLVKRLGALILIRIAVIVGVIAALSLLLLPANIWLEGYWIIAPFTLFIFGLFLVQLNALGFAIGFIVDATLRDSAAAVQSFLYLIVAAIVGQATSILTVKSNYVFGGLFITINLLLLIMLSLVNRKEYITNAK